MSSTKHSENRIHAILNDCQLPDNEAEQERVLRAFENELAAAVGELGLHPERTKVLNGHLYAQIHANCPDCNRPVSLREPELVDNAAYAMATCTNCEWSGQAVYRVVDFVDTEQVAYAWCSNYSAVRRGALDPLYVPY
jgi:hypothetical protein